MGSKYLTLENEVLKVRFDPKTGALVELVSQATRWRIIGRAKLGLSFGMVVPLPDRLNHRVFGEKQRLTRFALDPDGQRLTLTWQRPVSETGLTLDLTFTGIVALTEFGLEFTGEMANRTEHTVCTVAWPCVGEITPPGKDGRLDSYVACNTDLCHRSLLPVFANDQGYWGADYPTQKAHTPHTAFVMAGNETQGLCVDHHHTQNQELVQFLFELKPGWRDSVSNRTPAGPTIGKEPVRVQLAVNHFTYAAPGKTAALTPIVLRPYVGTWHAGVDGYKRWRATWHKPAPTPDWCLAIHAWLQVQINSIAGEQRCRYADLDRHGRQCAKHGVEVIQLTGWTEHGQDGRMPSHDIDPRLGTREELRAAIARLHRLGVRTVLYEKMVYADVSTERYRRELDPLMVQDEFGNRAGHAGWAYFLPWHFADFNRRRLNWGCMHHPEWRRVCRDEYERSLDLDADGVLLDESCQRGSDDRMCFAPDHGHPVPAFNPQGDNLLMAELNAIAARQKRPQLICAEASHDLQTMEYGMAYTRFGAGHIPLLRYIDPFYPIMMAVTGYDDREKINACLMFRYILSYEPLCFKGYLDDFPFTIAYGKKVDALRRRYQAQVWSAVFQDRVGATVTANGKPHPDYTVFRQPDSGRSTVVLVNHNSAKTLRAKVVIGRRAGPWLMATPEDPAARLVRGHVSVPPRSAALVLEA